jgi:hypothetical protein
MAMKYCEHVQQWLTLRIFLPVLMFIPFFLASDIHGALLYKNYVVRYDRGWDILCDPYQIRQGDWVLKIFRQKGEIAHDDFREFLGIFQRLNPHVKDIDRIRPGQVVDIPLKKLVQGNLPGQSSGMVTIPFVMISSPKEMIEKHTRSYTVQRGDTVSTLIARRFGGRYGNKTYSQGLKLFKAANPHIKDVNRIYAGQKIYMPDPSIREQSWYQTLFDEAGNLVEKMADSAESETDAPPSQPAAAAAPEMPRPFSGGNNHRTGCRGRIGYRRPTAGQRNLFLPMKQGKDFRTGPFALPHHRPAERLQSDSVRSGPGNECRSALIQSYWEKVKVARVPENASAKDILEAVFSAFSGEATTNQLAFEDGGAAIRVSAKWIRTETSADGRVPRHACITPIMSAGEQTHGAIVRYLDQNDIVVKDILTGESGAIRPTVQPDAVADVDRIDGTSQKALLGSFAQLMGFHYSPNTSISFPYAGIQVQALSNLLSFGNGREILVDFGDLYGDAVEAIRGTGLDILQINVDAGPVEIIARLMETAGMAYTTSPVFYAANRPADFNTAITINGILVPTQSGTNRLFIQEKMPELIELFIRDQGVRLVRIEAPRG